MAQPPDAAVRCAVPARFACMRRLRMYATPAELLLIGQDAGDDSGGGGGGGAPPPPPRFRVVQLDRTVAKPTALADVLVAHQALYDAEAVDSLLRGLYRRRGVQLPAGAAFSGLERYAGTLGGGGGAAAARSAAAADAVDTLDCAAWLGCVQFTRGYYLLVATSAQTIGVVGGHAVLAVRATELVPVHYEQPASHKSTWQRLQERLGSADAEGVVEGRYQSLFLSLDLTKDFYFSYTYDVTRPVQQQVVQTVAAAPAGAGAGAGGGGGGGHAGDAGGCAPPPPDGEPAPKFHWNAFLTGELTGCGVHASWTVSLACCFFQQLELSLFGRPLRLTLLARRSRFYAGTRYLKRGVCSPGHVGNEVEVEQVLEDVASGATSAFVQLRGSVPTYWMQRAAVAVPKPPILLQPRDLTYAPARRHFAAVLARYGAPVLAVNLVKKKEAGARERLVGREYARLVGALNRELPPGAQLQYLALDYNAVVKGKRHNLVAALRDVGRWTAANVGFFCNAQLPGALLAHRHAQRAYRERRVAAPLPGLPGAPPPHAPPPGGEAEDTDEGDEWMARLSGWPRIRPAQLPPAAAGGSAAAAEDAASSPAGDAPQIPGALLAPDNADAPGGYTAPATAPYFASLCQLQAYPVVQMGGAEGGVAAAAAAAAAAGEVPARPPTRAPSAGTPLLGSGSSAAGAIPAYEPRHQPHYYRQPARLADAGATQQPLSSGSGSGSGSSGGGGALPAKASLASRGSGGSSGSGGGGGGGVAGHGAPPPSMTVGFPVTPALALLPPSAAGAVPDETSTAEGTAALGGIWSAPTAATGAHASTFDGPNANPASAASTSGEPANEVQPEDSEEEEEPGGVDARGNGGAGHTSGGDESGGDSPRSGGGSSIVSDSTHLTHEGAPRGGAAARGGRRGAGGGGNGNPGALLPPRWEAGVSTAAALAAHASLTAASTLAGGGGGGGGGGAPPAIAAGSLPALRQLPEDHPPGGLGRNKRLAGRLADDSAGPSTALADGATTASLHVRGLAQAAACAARSRHTMRCTEAQDAAAGAKLGLGARMREYERAGSQAEYSFVDLVGTPHGYAPQAPVRAAGLAALVDEATRRQPSAPPASGAVAVPAVAAFPALGLSFQSGVLRTNCIDNLDRTNVAQVCVGTHLLGLQLHALGLSDSETLDPSGPLVRHLMALYEEMGDAIAMQYGGSEANKKVTTDEHAEAVHSGIDGGEDSVAASAARAAAAAEQAAAEQAAAGGGPVGGMLGFRSLFGQSAASAKVSRLGGHSATELLSSLQRYYANSFTDGVKQASINLFLGLYQPRLHAPAPASSGASGGTGGGGCHLWELETDFYLHNPGTALLLSAPSSAAAAPVSAAASTPPPPPAASSVPQLADLASGGGLAVLSPVPQQGAGRLGVDDLRAVPNDPTADGDVLGSDWWTSPLQAFLQTGLPRVELLLTPPPPSLLAPSPPGSSSSSQTPSDPLSRAEGAALSPVASTAGGEGSRHQHVHFDELLSQPHAAPKRAAVPVPEKPQPSQSTARSLLPRHLTGGDAQLDAGAADGVSTASTQAAGAAGGLAAGRPPNLLTGVKQQSTLHPVAGAGLHLGASAAAAAAAAGAAAVTSVAAAAGAVVARTAKELDRAVAATTGARSAAGGPPSAAAAAAAAAAASAATAADGTAAAAGSGGRPAPASSAPVGVAGMDRHLLGASLFADVFISMGQADRIPGAAAAADRAAEEREERTGGGAPAAAAAASLASALPSLASAAQRHMHSLGSQYSHAAHGLLDRVSAKAARAAEAVATMQPAQRLQAALPGSLRRWLPAGATAGSASSLPPYAHSRGAAKTAAHVGHAYAAADAVTSDTEGGTADEGDASGGAPTAVTAAPTQPSMASSAEYPGGDRLYPVRRSGGSSGGGGGDEAGGGGGGGGGLYARYESLAVASGLSAGGGGGADVVASDATGVDEGSSGGGAASSSIITTQLPAFVAGTAVLPKRRQGGGAMHIMTTRDQIELFRHAVGAHEAAGADLDDCQRWQGEWLSSAGGGAGGAGAAPADGLLLEGDDAAAAAALGGLSSARVALSSQGGQGALADAAVYGGGAVLLGVEGADAPVEAVRVLLVGAAPAPAAEARPGAGRAPVN